jgi:hypothetical protein
MNTNHYSALGAFIEKQREARERLRERIGRFEAGTVALIASHGNGPVMDVSEETISCDKRILIEMNRQIADPEILRETLRTQ